ncbi:prepilin peptidase [Shouchella patagoniensis]|uniref:prepilin peptidase n=1 Tax=Shouchella patagoniensis TaxID=228576 RepID=UPI000994A8C6|nr:A24 family peptidase [Shouchella patagoniensis]
MSVLFTMHVYLFTIGTVIGSYLLVAAKRTPLLASIFGRSSCLFCKRKLGSVDLVPILSYVCLSGKCRTCKNKIPIIYPLTEFVCGVLFLTASLLIGARPQLAIALFLISLLILVTLTDIMRMVIPNDVLIVFAIPLLTLRFIFVPIELNGYLLGAGLLLLIILICASIKNQLGGGDVKLFILLAIVVGIKPLLYIIALSSLLALLYVLHSLLAKKIKKDTHIPFAPFISIAALIVYFTIHVV